MNTLLPGSEGERRRQNMPQRGSRTRVVRAWLGLALLVGLAVGLARHFGRPDAERARSLGALSQLNSLVQQSPSTNLLEWVVAPEVLKGKSPQEQGRWVAEVLRDELSPAGLEILKREASFGPLEKLFPAEASTWTQFSAISPTNCVAFRMNRGAVTAEVVLARFEDRYKVIRCNNVRQMAELSK